MNSNELTVNCNAGTMLAILSRDQLKDARCNAKAHGSLWQCQNSSRILRGLPAMDLIAGQDQTMLRPSRRSRSNQRPAHDLSPTNSQATLTNYPTTATRFIPGRLCLLPTPFRFLASPSQQAREITAPLGPSNTLCLCSKQCGREFSSSVSSLQSLEIIVDV